jgi:hypothetical protein
MIIMKRMVFSLRVACRLSGLHYIVERPDLNSTGRRSFLF